MDWNPHSNLVGCHAFLSASKYSWINYDIDKLADSFKNFTAAQRGTELHDFAATCIRLGQRLPKSSKTLNSYVNDAIGYKMSPEQVLYYSNNCYGTADSICYRNGLLRIHDLKTGSTPAHMEQLMIYAALFFLEYGKAMNIRPGKTDMILRLYQSDDIQELAPTSEQIEPIMEKIILFDKTINQIKEQEA